MIHSYVTQRPDQVSSRLLSLALTVSNEDVLGGSPDSGLLLTSSTSAPFSSFVSFLGTTVSLAYLTSLPPLLEIDHEGRDLVLLIATPLNLKLHWPRQVQGSTLERSNATLFQSEAESMCWGL